ncbi:MAG: HNH endonuclease [Clostridium sp.]
MFFINTDYKNTENTYEIQGDVTLITLLNKKGSQLIAKIDTDDIDKVKNMGVWFGEWHKDFNNYIVQNVTSGDNSKKSKLVKQSLQSVILNVSSKAPIKHLNGDILDNRKSNLEVVERNAKNTYEIIDGATVAVLLTDKNGNVSSKALISRNDLNTVVTDGLSWVEYKTKDNIYVIANTPNGRIYLNQMLMNSEDGEIIHHINLNPLDCRRENMEIKTKTVAETN